LEIHHFCRSAKINACIKLLLSHVHGGFIWLNKVVLIDTYLIVWITRLPTQGKDPFPLFTEKDNEKALSERIKEKYGTYRGARGIDVASINDDIIRFVTQVLACKLLRKCPKDQVPMGAMVVVEKCVARVMMNWSTFLVNPFFMDYWESQEKGTKFHYAWLLILIALTAWMEPEETKFLEGIHNTVLAMRYMSLWNTTHKD